MAWCSFNRVRAVVVHMAAQASVPRPAIPLPAPRLRTTRFFASTAVVLEAVSKRLSRSLKGAPADEARRELQEGFMDLGKSLIADSKTMEIMEPSMSTFDYPSVFSEATAMLGAALGKNGFDTPIAQFSPVCFGVVSAIGIDDLRLLQRAPADTTNGRNRVNERQQLCDVMAMCTGQIDRERHPVCVGSNMVLGARSPTIYGVRPCFWPAPIARTVDESRFTRARSIWSAARNSASISSCNRSHTPASCQSRKRRQHVTPEPQPISAGRSRQRIPVRNTNKMPLNAARSGIGLRPGYFSRRGFGCGSKGSIRFHNSSSMIGLSIPLTSSSRRPRLTACP
ncbi:MAG: hypothetical protein JWR14_5256 [Caballeronia sp.]|nr:hypothetical protein [Caballeronia sp.]